MAYLVLVRSAVTRLASFAVILLLLCGPFVAAEPQDGVALDHDPSLAELAQGRDLKEYDNGGHYSEKQNDPVTFIAMRRFIWDHWRLKKRGYVEFTFSVSVDAWVEEHIFIEPTKEGEWHIQFRNILGWSGGGVIRRTLVEDDFVSLEREPPAAGDYDGKEALIFRGRDRRSRKI